MSEEPISIFQRRANASNEELRQRLAVIQQRQRRLSSVLLLWSAYRGFLGILTPTTVGISIGLQIMQTVLSWQAGVPAAVQVVMNNWCNNGQWAVLAFVLLNLAVNILWRRWMRRYQDVTNKQTRALQVSVFDQLAGHLAGHLRDERYGSATPFPHSVDADDEDEDDSAELIRRHDEMTAEWDEMRHRWWRNHTPSSSSSSSSPDGIPFV